MTGVWLIGFLYAVLRISIPYVMAALGGTVSERSGVINIALEGFLLTAAMGTALCAPHGPLAAALGGLLAGMAMAVLYALLTVVLRGDQIVCGVAMFLLADGLSRFLLKVAFGSTSNSPRLALLEGRWVPLFLVLAIGSVVALEGILRGTVFGLRLRAAGEHPDAARMLGVSVVRVRFGAVCLSGLLTAVGGVWLVFDQRQFVALMSGGRGFIALAAMIFGGWSPLRAAGAALLFASAEALAIRLQAMGLGIPNWVVQMSPYLLTILLLTLRGMLGGRSRAPAALGKPLP